MCINVSNTAPQPTWFIVNVPVLSLHMVVAEPIVSQAESLLTYNSMCYVTHIIIPKANKSTNINWHTKALSAIIFRIE